MLGNGISTINIKLLSYLTLLGSLLPGAVRLERCHAQEYREADLTLDHGIQRPSLDTMHLPVSLPSVASLLKL